MSDTCVKQETCLKHDSAPSLALPVHSQWLPVTPERILRTRKGLYEIEYADGTVAWCSAPQVESSAPTLVDTFRDSAPLRKKRRQEARDLKRRRIAASEACLHSSDGATLLQCFLLELAVAFKSYFTSERFAYTRRVTFRVNYAKRLSSTLLLRAAVSRFGPPLQQLRAACDASLARITPVEVRDHIYGLAGLPTASSGWASDRLDLGHPIVRDGVLAMALPRRVDDSSLRRLLPSLISEWRILYDKWWDDAPCQGRICLAEAIARVEKVAASPCTSMRLLLNADEPIAPATPHSLELVVRCDGAVVATIVVPSNAKLSQLAAWLRSRVANRARLAELDGSCDLILVGPLHHGGGIYDTLRVRVSRAQTKAHNPAYHRSRSPGAKWEQARFVFGGRNQLLDYFRSNASPGDLDPHAEDQFRRAPDYYLHERSLLFTGSPSLEIGLCVDCALVDILPMPEDHSPPMDTLIRRLTAACGRYAYRSFGYCASAHFAFSKASASLSVACVRRFPRLHRDADYPIVKLCRTAPNCFLPFHET